MKSPTGHSSSGGAGGGEDESKEQEGHRDVRSNNDRGPQHRHLSMPPVASEYNLRPLTSQQGADISGTVGLDQQYQQTTSPGLEENARQVREYVRLNRGYRAHILQQQRIQAGAGAPPSGSLPSASPAPSAAAASPRPNFPPSSHDVIDAQVREYARLQDARFRQSTTQSLGNPTGNRLEASISQPAASASLSAGWPRHAQIILPAHDDAQANEDDAILRAYLQQLYEEVGEEQNTPFSRAEPEPIAGDGGGIEGMSIQFTQHQPHCLAFAERTQHSTRPVRCCNPSCRADLFTRPDATRFACQICGRHSPV